MQFKKNPRVR